MATDVTVHDRSGLLLAQSPPPTEAEINQAELVGIADAAEWIKRTRLDVREIKLWQRLHKEMFGDVWEWAGQWRQHEPNIGRVPYEIQPKLRELQDDLAFWLSENCDMQPIEILARFHYRLVYVHPFSNGNGRWGRLLTDALAIRELGLDALTWAANADDLRNPESPERQRYIAAIKAGDKGDFDPLMGYIRDRNLGLA